MSEFKDFLTLPLESQDEIRQRAMRYVEAQSKFQQAFGQWYTDKTGILTIGAVIKVGDDRFKVLHHDDRVPGYFLLLPLNAEQPATGLLADTLRVFLQPPPPGGAGDLLTAMAKHMTDFMAEVPEAQDWATQMRLARLE